MEEEVEEEVVMVGEEVEMGVVFGAEVADGDVVELLALVVMLLMLSVCGVCVCICVCVCVCAHTLIIVSTV